MKRNMKHREFYLTKKFIPVLTLVLVILVLFQTVNIEEASAKGANKSVTILFTHDMHDNLLPFQTIEDGKAVKRGGYARLKNAIDAHKKSETGAVLVDAGDFSMGTPFQTIYASDAPELRMLGALGYDVATLGNHEFDYRPSGLTDSLKAAVVSGDPVPKLVQSNVEFPTDKSGKMTASVQELKLAMEEYGVYDYTILERDGTKIGVFGLIGEEAESMAPMSEVTFRDEVEQAKRVVKLLKEQEKVDFILCLSHSGTKADQKESEDEILAKEVPEINMIISGHTHTTLSKPILVGNTVIGSAGSYGKNLGVARMTQNADHNWSLADYKLVAVDNNFAEDSSIAKEVDQYKRLVQDKYFNQFGLDYDEVIAYSDFQFKTPDEIYAVHEEATIGNLISDAYIYSVKKAEGKDYTKIAAAIVPCGTIRDTIFKGDVTTANAFNISSLGIGVDGMPGYPLISVYLTGKELKTACEVDASITPLMGDAQLYMSGINYTFHPKRLIFNKVTKAVLIKEDGSSEPIIEDKLYRIVCNLYSAQMLSIVGEKSFGLMSIVPKDKEGNVITDFEKYIIYQPSEDGKSELKEWYAVVQYLKSFDKKEGVPHVPAYYQTTQGRKVIESNNNITVLFGNPNRIAVTVYLIAGTLLLLLVLLIYRIATRKNRRKSTKHRKKRSR